MIIRRLTETRSQWSRLTENIMETRTKTKHTPNITPGSGRRAGTGWRQGRPPGWVSRPWRIRQLGEPWQTRSFRRPRQIRSFWPSWRIRSFRRPWRIWLRCLGLSEYWTGQVKTRETLETMKGWTGPAEARESILERALGLERHWSKLWGWSRHWS